MFADCSTPAGSPSLLRQKLHSCPTIPSLYCLSTLLSKT
uniref:Uncharacterized protein n=1 Tax=Anguilla anguilla TaxID=7936 RepID=A0A0E9WRP0_ANGAN